MRTEFLCVSVLIVASGPRVKLASCKSALNPMMACSTDRSKSVVPVLVLLFVALWFILRGYLLYVFPCVILFLCFSVLLVLRLRLGKRELILVLFSYLFFTSEIPAQYLARLPIQTYARQFRRGSETCKKGKRKVQGVPQSQTAALPRPQEEEETDKPKQAQTEQTYEKY